MTNSSHESELGFGLWSAIKKKAVDHVASVVIVGGAGLLALAGTTTWAAIKSWTVIDLPTGVVLAFTSECPKSGWDEYKEGWGRFVVGAFKEERRNEIPGGFIRDARGVDLSAKPFGAPGGEEAHVLKETELPTHHHKLFSVSAWTNGDDLTPDNTVKQSAFPGADPSYILRGQNLPATLAKSSDTGGGMAHNNMPPYVALHLCKKR